MCIIAFAPDHTKRPSEEVLKRCWDSNPDGAGFMYPSDDGKAVIVSKGHMTWDDYITNYRAAPTDRPICSHFRIRSHGAKSAEMTHPFYADSEQQIAFVHNGMLGHALGTDPKSSDSDTAHLSKLLQTLDMDVFANEFFIHMLEDYIGLGNKMVFLAMDSTHIILNEKQGTWENGVWFSNHSFRVERPVIKGRGRGAYGRYGGGYLHPDDVDEYHGYGDWKPKTDTEPVAGGYWQKTVAEREAAAIAARSTGRPAVGKEVITLKPLPEAAQWCNTANCWVTVSRAGNVSGWKYDNNNGVYELFHWWRKDRLSTDMAKEINQLTQRVAHRASMRNYRAKDALDAKLESASSLAEIDKLLADAAELDTAAIDAEAKGSDETQELVIPTDEQVRIHMGP